MNNKIGFKLIRDNISTVSNMGPTGGFHTYVDKKYHRFITRFFNLIEEAMK